MECNKEEAVRAMQLAQKKMHDHDFQGAQRIAEKAQRLFPDLENISQLLTVCKVHCSAQVRLGGTEKDWYRILQVEQTVDAVTIKKQYRKLALLLHPDKNKFAGAEAAFKLIGEAHRVLSDQASRSSYDMKCRVLVKTDKPSFRQPKGNSFCQKQHGAANNLQNHPRPQSSGWYWHQQPQPPTFWTSCSSCHTRYQYYRECLNKILVCPNCRKNFIANELGMQGSPPGSFWGQFRHQKEAPNQGSPKVASQGNNKKPSGKSSPNTSVGAKPMSKTGSKSKIEERDNADVPVTKQGVGMPEHDSVKSKKKRGRKLVVESSESFGAQTEDDDMEVNVADSSTVSERNRPRRSSRQKRNVSYKDNVSDDDDFVSPPKRARVSKLSDASDDFSRKASENGGIANDDLPAGSSTPIDEHKRDFKQSASVPLEESLTGKKNEAHKPEVEGEETEVPDHSDQKSKTDDGSESKQNEASIPESFSYPDPEFSDFDKGRAESCFAVNQTWALYDPLDGMPRFYALIKKVLSPGFKLKITWLEASPDDEAEIDWCDRELPVGCGKYMLGDTQTVDHGMFSHQMRSIKGSRRSTYMVYPKKGETWALFQNWDINWRSDPQKHQPFKFEFVEVLSDFVADAGIRVAYLGRVKGFVCLFKQTEQHGILSFEIPPNELYRFSHRVPSFRFSGEEREVVPKGSYELDPSSLPTSFFESGDYSNAKMENGSISAGISVSCCKSQKSEAGNVSGSEGVPALGKNKSSSSKKETLLPRKSPRKSNSNGQTGGSQVVAVDGGKNDPNNGNVSPSKRSASVRQAVEGINTPKNQGSNHEAEAFKLRRSPRDVSKKKSEVNGSQLTNEEVSTKQAHPSKDGNSGFSSHTTSSSSVVQKSSSMKNHCAKMSAGSPAAEPSTGSSVKDQCAKMSARSPTAEPSVTPKRKLMQAECFDFTQQKSEEKFKADQIWALHTEGVLKPTTYAKVKKIDKTPEFQVHVALLEPCSQSKDRSHPVCCGIFKVKNRATGVFSLSSFSHRLNAKAMGANEYEIYPRKGEIWALHKSQNSDLSCPIPSKGECDIVEVLEENDQSTKVVLLFRLSGYKSLFKAPRIQRSKAGMLDIPRAEIARFLHQIPAFQHTGESDSRLAGCWELDPSSIPVSIICLD